VGRKSAAAVELGPRSETGLIRLTTEKREGEKGRSALKKDKEGVDSIDEKKIGRL